MLSLTDTNLIFIRPVPFPFLNVSVQTWAMSQTERWKESVMRIRGFHVPQNCEVAILLFFPSICYLHGSMQGVVLGGSSLSIGWLAEFLIQYTFWRVGARSLENAPQCDYKKWSPGKGRTLSICFLCFLLSFPNHLTWLNLYQSTHRVLSALVNVHVKWDSQRS